VSALILEGIQGNRAYRNTVALGWEAPVLHERGQVARSVRMGPVHSILALLHISTHAMHSNKCPYCLKGFESEHRLYAHYGQRPCTEYRAKHLHQLGAKEHQSLEVELSRHAALVLKAQKVHIALPCS
jgi:hypothetical protein